MEKEETPEFLTPKSSYHSFSGTPAAVSYSVEQEAPAKRESRPSVNLHRSPIAPHQQQFHFKSNTYTVKETDGSLLVWVVRKGPTQFPANVIYSTENGTARENVNYLPARGILHFEAGEVEKSITVHVLPDSNMRKYVLFYVELYEGGRDANGREAKSRPQQTLRDALHLTGPLRTTVFVTDSRVWVTNYFLRVFNSPIYRVTLVLAMLFGILAPPLQILLAPSSLDDLFDVCYILVASLFIMDVVFHIWARWPWGYLLSSNFLMDLVALAGAFMLLDWLAALVRPKQMLGPDLYMWELKRTEWGQVARTMKLGLLTADFGEVSIHFVQWLILTIKQIKARLRRSAARVRALRKREKALASGPGDAASPFREGPWGATSPGSAEHYFTIHHSYYAGNSLDLQGRPSAVSMARSSGFDAEGFGVPPGRPSLALGEEDPAREGSFVGTDGGEAGQEDAERDAQEQKKKKKHVTDWKATHRPSKVVLTVVEEIVTKLIKMLTLVSITLVLLTLKPCSTNDRGLLMINTAYMRLGDASPEYQRMLQVYAEPRTPEEQLGVEQPCCDTSVVQTRLVYLKVNGTEDGDYVDEGRLSRLREFTEMQFIGYNQEPSGSYIPCRIDTHRGVVASARSSSCLTVSIFSGQSQHQALARTYLFLALAMAGLVVGGVVFIMVDMLTNVLTPLIRLAQHAHSLKEALSDIEVELNNLGLSMSLTKKSRKRRKEKQKRNAAAKSKHKNVKAGKGPQGNNNKDGQTSAESKLGESNGGAEDPESLRALGDAPSRKGGDARSQGAGGEGVDSDGSDGQEEAGDVDVAVTTALLSCKQRKATELMKDAYQKYEVLFGRPVALLIEYLREIEEAFDLPLAEYTSALTRLRTMLEKRWPTLQYLAASWDAGTLTQEHARAALAHLKPHLPHALRRLLRLLRREARIAAGSQRRLGGASAVGSATTSGGTDRTKLYLPAKVLVTLEAVASLAEDILNAMSAGVERVIRRGLQADADHPVTSAMLVEYALKLIRPRLQRRLKELGETVPDAIKSMTFPQLAMLVQELLKQRVVRRLQVVAHLHPPPPPDCSLKELHRWGEKALALHLLDRMRAAHVPISDKMLRCQTARALLLEVDAEVERGMREQLRAMRYHIPPNAKGFADLRWLQVEAMRRRNPTCRVMLALRSGIQAWGQTKDDPTVAKRDAADISSPALHDTAAGGSVSRHSSHKSALAVRATWGEEQSEAGALWERQLQELGRIKALRRVFADVLNMMRQRAVWRGCRSLLQVFDSMHILTTGTFTLSGLAEQLRIQAGILRLFLRSMGPIAPSPSPMANGVYKPPDPLDLAAPPSLPTQPSTASFPPTGTPWEGSRVPTHSSGQSEASFSFPLGSFDAAEDASSTYCSWAAQSREPSGSEQGGHAGASSLRRVMSFDRHTSHDGELQQLDRQLPLNSAGSADARDPAAFTSTRALAGGLSSGDLSSLGSSRNVSWGGTPRAWHRRDASSSNNLAEEGGKAMHGLGASFLGGPGSLPHRPGDSATAKFVGGSDSLERMDSISLAPEGSHVNGYNGDKYRANHVEGGRGAVHSPLGAAAAGIGQQGPALDPQGVLRAEQEEAELMQREFLEMADVVSQMAILASAVTRRRRNQLREAQEVIQKQLGGLKYFMGVATMAARSGEDDVSSSHSGSSSPSGSSSSGGATPGELSEEEGEGEGGIGRERERHSTKKERRRAKEKAKKAGAGQGEKTWKAQVADEICRELVKPPSPSRPRWRQSPCPAVAAAGWGSVWPLPVGAATSRHRHRRRSSR
eukprot:jgi/Mesvir1/1086/Mv17598-RA.1